VEQYQLLIREILTDGTVTPNRTGINATKLDGAMMRFRLRTGFPAVTSKKLAWKAITGELCAFLRSARSAATFRELGCKVWDDNANGPGQMNDAGEVTTPNPWLTNPFRTGEDDLGPVYGVQWREWPGIKIIPHPERGHREAIDRHSAIVKKIEADGWQLIGNTVYDEDGEHEAGEESGGIYYKAIDQLGDCVRKVIRTPHDRRILFHAWNPSVMDEIALPACHLLYQFLPNTVTQELNMILYIRSNDVCLGTPFNIAEAALLTELVTRLTGYKAGRLTYFIGDAHIYDNQLDYLGELLSKDPLPLPTLAINDRIPNYREAVAAGMDNATAVEQAVEWLKLVEPTDFVLENYQCHTLITPVPKMVI
jgi:thymidylate synthase